MVLASLLVGVVMPMHLSRRSSYIAAHFIDPDFIVDKPQISRKSLVGRKERHKPVDQICDLRGKLFSKSVREGIGGLTNSTKLIYAIDDPTTARGRVEERKLGDGPLLTGRCPISGRSTMYGDLV